MTDRMEREQELFHACIQLTPPEREEYLSRACRENQPLRKRIDRLVQAHERAEDATLDPHGSLWRREDPGRIDRYRIVRALGEGGMGVVYEAQQLEPVRRRVALKIVKLGLDTAQVLARFSLERQVLASMDHPYVATVFDAGQTAAGRPYFVMELVEGVPLLEYCERNHLSKERRIELVARVCQAVQHSHQKGVIHRDLKPSNILVASSPAGPIPKIIDFGIAKAVDLDGAAAATALTRSGQTLGTPAYMSPEQAARGGIDVDTRTDVYALGVILYELLAGCLPADPAQSGFAEFLVLLGRGELRPARPSARAATQALKRQLEGDLDWIVMKAIESGRERRYATALALAEDLERYLRREPVAARPPTISYRVGKFVRRHRVQVAASLLVLAALVGGAIAAGIGFVRASRAEAAARQEAATAKEVSEFLVRLFSLPDPNGAPGAAMSVRDLLDRGARRIEAELKGQPRVQSNLLGTMSHVYESLGQYREAKQLAEKALAVESSAKLTQNLKTSDALLSLGRVDQRMGDFEGARRAFTRALEIRIRLEGENSLSVGTIWNNLGALLGQLEKFDEAIAAHRRALAIQRKAGGAGHISAFNSLRGLGMIEDRKGNWQPALEWFRASYALAAGRYGENHPLVADALNNTARMLRQLHRLDEARRDVERAVAIQKRLSGADHPGVAFTCHTLGRVLEEQGRLTEALAMYREALRIFSAAQGPESLPAARTLGSLGRLQARLGNLGAARRSTARSYEIHNRVYGPDHRETVEAGRQLASVEARIARRAP